MKRLLSLLFLLPVCCLAQQAAPTSQDTRPLLERMFGSYPTVTPYRKSPAATPTPTPRHKSKKQAPTVTPTPTPTPEESPTAAKSRKSRHRKHKPAAEPSETPEASPSASPAPAPSGTPKPSPTPTPAPKPTPSPKPSPKPSPTPRARKGHKSAQASPTPTPSPEKTEAPSPLNVANPFVPGESPSESESAADKDAQERAHFNDIKTKALEDDKVLALKEKMDTAGSAEEQAKASKVYYNALYDKMRKLDPALKERIDRMQALTSKRLEQTP